MAARPPWLHLFAPLPPDASPRRSPVAAPGSAGGEPGSPIAGWTSLVLDLPALPHGTRVLMATLDADGRLISGSDWVMLRTAQTMQGVQIVEYRHESVGGRFEHDGSFRGTRWVTVQREGEDPDADPERVSATPSPATGDDARALRAMMDELMRRSGAA